MTSINEVSVSPKLKRVNKYKPPYPLSKFPKDFVMAFGKAMIAKLATRSVPTFEGAEWEEVFAQCIHAQWHPSNVGLDDVVFEQTAWSAKTIKNKKPYNAKTIRLICGRNSPIYSFGDVQITNQDPDDLGRKVLEIWNERISEVQKQFKYLRTIVLIKGEDLLEFAIFEKETLPIAIDDYTWQWNEKNNLEGLDRMTRKHCFTWQPHGSQFTMVVDVPQDKLCIRIKNPRKISEEEVLTSLDFDESWVEVVNPNEQN